MKIEIKSRFAGNVLFSVETKTLKLAVEAAVKSGADLSGAYLSGAYLSGAYLSRAYLSGADLSGADLSGADLSGAKDDENTRYPPYQIPQTGSMEVFKKVMVKNERSLLNERLIAKLLVPAKAKRTASLVGRKCRAEYVEVLELEGGVKTGTGWYDETTKYEVGKITRPDKYDPDPKVECTHGIHFYLTKEEAEND
jgi:hypothetical protein